MNNSRNLVNEYGHSLIRMMNAYFAILRSKRAFMLKASFLFILFSSSFYLSAQSISKSDSLYLASMRTELSLSPEQSHFADSLITVSSYELANIEKESQRLARSNSPQEEKDASMSSLLSRKKTIKEERELSLRQMLSPDQLKIYDEKIKPAKPAVLHMGINHDRAKCTVCLPK